MEFQQNSFDALLSKIKKYLDRLQNDLKEDMEAARESVDAWYIPTSIAEFILDIVEKVAEFCIWVHKKFIEFLEGYWAPITFAKLSWEWSTVRGEASLVSGQVKPDVLRGVSQWSGPAAGEYSKSVKTQADAADRITSLAAKFSSALDKCAVAGFVFYAAMAVAAAQLIAGAVAAKAAMRSPVTIPAGAAAFAASTGLSVALVTGAAAALVNMMTSFWAEASALYGEAVDQGAFPKGNWPDPFSAKFGDASVKNRDYAPWSLERR